MIHLTRLNNQPLVVNADLIKFIENAPDTVITLLTGEKLVVRESVAEVLKRIGEFHDRFYRRVAPTVVFDTSPPGDPPGPKREAAGGAGNKTSGGAANS
ncbi:MAG TPA: flagellar FlbD family protein [Candidatus Aquilonibacter sp.]|nr:flagellar FlbD family protein [Candidatus Aquilonibacter sp.]